MATDDGEHVRDMMGCDHPSFIQIGPLIDKLWLSNIFQLCGRPPSWILKTLIFGYVAVIEVLTPNLLLCTKFHQNWFTRSASRLLNVQCAVASQRPLSWHPHHGGHVWDMMGCDHTSFVEMDILVGELWHFQHFPTWRPSAILNWNFIDLIFSAGDIVILWFCQFGDFASLAEKCLTTPFLGVWLNPIKMWVVIQTHKRHILGWGLVMI